MSVEQIEASIRALPPTKRAQLVEWLEIHRAELVADVDEISPQVRDELELRACVFALRSFCIVPA